MSGLRSIFLVEDNPVDVDLTLRAFRRKNFANPIEVFRDGQEIVDWISRWNLGDEVPAVVLLDLKLPKVSGKDVLREFKAHPELRKLPIVILSVSGQEKDIEQAYDIGANSYIVKPVDFDDFMEVVSQIELYWGVINKTTL